MSSYKTTIRNLVVTSPTTFHFDFDILSGEDRVASLSCGAAIDGHDYMMIDDPTGEVRGFDFDFDLLKKEITSESVINIIIKIMDYDGNIQESAFSKMFPIENNRCFIDNMTISQRNDGSMLVDVFYDLVSPNEVDPALVTFYISDASEHYVVPTTTATGDIGEGVPTGPKRHIIWNPTTDYADGGGISIRAMVRAYSYRTQNYYSAESGSLILASPSITPIIAFISDSEKAKYGIQDGELFKNLSVEFAAINSSSTSSLET